MPASPVLPKLVGQRVKRREDPRLIQGRGTYVDDVKIAGMQHIAFKRSDIAALEGHVLHPDDLHVVNVGAQALDEARVFAPFNALTNQLRQYRSRHDYLLPAAYCTALTMC